MTLGEMTTITEQPNYRTWWYWLKPDCHRLNRHFVLHLLSFYRVKYSDVCINVFCICATVYERDRAPRAAQRRIFTAERKLLHMVQLSFTYRRRRQSSFTAAARNRRRMMKCILLAFVIPTDVRCVFLIIWWLATAAAAAALAAHSSRPAKCASGIG